MIENKSSKSFAVSLRIKPASTQFESEQLANYRTHISYKLFHEYGVFLDKFNAYIVLTKEEDERNESLELTLILDQYISIEIMSTLVAEALVVSDLDRVFAMQLICAGLIWHPSTSN